MLLLLYYCAVYQVYVGFSPTPPLSLCQTSMSVIPLAVK